MVSVDSGEEGRYDIPKPPWGALRKNLKREITCSDFNFSKRILVSFKQQSIRQPIIPFEV